MWLAPTADETARARRPARRSRTPRRAHRRRHRDGRRGARRGPPVATAERLRRARPRCARTPLRAAARGRLCRRAAGGRVDRGTRVPARARRTLLDRWRVCPLTCPDASDSAGSGATRPARSGSSSSSSACSSSRGSPRLGSVVGWVISVANSAPDARTRSKPIELGADLARLRRRRHAPRVHPGQRAAHAGLLEAQIPQNIKDAIVAVEDRRFFEHQGVDFEGIVRAGVKNLENRHEIQGGSTLTMQLVRNLYTGEKRAHAQAQDPRGEARRGPREPAPGPPGQALDPHEVPQQRAVRHRRRPDRRRHPGRRAHLLRQAREQAEAPRGRAARRPAPGAVAVQPVPEPRAPRRRAATTSCSGWPTRATSSRRRPTARCAWASASSATATTPTAARATSSTSSSRSSSTSTASTRSAGAACGSTRRSTSAFSASRARRWTATSAPPDRSAAIVTIDPRTGYIKAMASSSRYGDSKFNLAAQGHRQAGSTFKVMVLMAALRRGVEPELDDLHVACRSRPAGCRRRRTTRSTPTATRYAGRISLVEGDAEVRQQRLRPARRRRRPRGRAPDRVRHGHQDAPARATRPRASAA